MGGMCREGWGCIGRVGGWDVWDGADEGIEALTPRHFLLDSHSRHSLIRQVFTEYH